MSVLTEAVVFLAAAVVVVPVSRMCGLGAVLGFLIAGAVIGPFGLRLVGDVEGVIHFAELGVVMLLFIIGLELQPSRLWTMRKAVFGLGGIQVVATAAALGIAAYASGLDLAAAIVVGLALSLSSTAFALQTLAEKNQLTARHGRAAFSILLFQDLAVIPILALLPLLTGGQAIDDAEIELMPIVKSVGMCLAIVVGERFVLRYAFRAIAATGIREVFTAMSLLTVIGTALLVESVGLTMALGAFLAGVLLAESEYRHTIEADIEPFKGLLLGLFFIAVGMSLNLGLIGSDAGTVAALVIGLVAVKFLILFVLGRMSELSNPSSRSLAVALSQGGEFAFVILSMAVDTRIIDQGLTDLLIPVVTLSMGVTPLLFILNDRVLKPSLGGGTRPEFDALPEEEHRVIIAGFGRFGQIIARILRAKRIPFTALEINPEQVDFVRRYGNEVYYGDASRLELLRAAKAEQATALVLAIDDVATSMKTAQTVREHFPNLPIYARARNRNHVHKLMDLGVKVIRRETFLASVDLAREVLQGLGMKEHEAEKAVNMFRDHDRRRLYRDYAHYNEEEKMQLLAMESAKELEALFASDAEKSREQ